MSDQEDFTDLWDLVRAFVTSQYINPLPRKEWVQDQGLEENDSYLVKFHRYDNSLAVYLGVDPNTLPSDTSGNAEEISKSLAELKHDNKPSAAEIRGRIEFLILEPRLKDFKLWSAHEKDREIRR